MNPNYTEINVEAAEKDPDSILNFYRKLLKFRKENDVVIYGTYEEIYKNSGEIYAFIRRLGTKTLLVVCSYSEKAVGFTSPAELQLAEAELAVNNYSPCGVVNNGFTLRPYETRVYIWNN